MKKVARWFTSTAKLIAAAFVVAMLLGGGCGTTGPRSMSGGYQATSKIYVELDTSPTMRNDTPMGPTIPNPNYFKLINRQDF